MAEFALGLTKTAVAGTVSRVKSAIEEEGKLRVLVQDDLVFITGEFQMMQSFLSASNLGERAANNQVVRTWVRQLRDLAFDVEDCVEFVVHLDKASRWDWVQRLASSVLVCGARQPLPIDVAAAEIKRLKSRVEDISQRNTRYNLMNGDDRPSDASHQLTSSTGSSSKATEAEAAATAFQVLKDAWKASGKLGDDHTDIDLRKLIDCHASERLVISLWCGGGGGGGGGGAADVGGHDARPNNYVVAMKKAYDHPEICHRFKHRAWVKRSSHHAFNPVKFINNLFTQFRSHRRDLQEEEEDDNNYHHHNQANNDSVSELLLQLRNHTYLIVVEEELNTVADWDAIRMCLPDGNNGSRVVVSTNNLGIAIVCTGHPYQVSELKRFSDGGGLYAIYPKGCGHRTGMGEFIWQLRQRGVISMFCRSYDEKEKIRDAFEYGIRQRGEYMNNSEVFDTVKLKRHYWYRTNDKKFQLEKLARCLFPVKKKLLRRMSEQDIIERCRVLLTEHDYLIFIEDVISVEDWEFIKQHLLCESTRGCIVVITGEQSFATHCVDHVEYRALNCRDVMKVFGQEKHIGRQGGRQVWPDSGAYNSPLYFDGETRTHCVWGIAGVGKTAMARSWCKNVGDYKVCCWVDVPHPFNLTDLCHRMLLDFCLDDVNAKETVAIGMMEGQDPVHACRKIPSEGECVLVLDGVQSTQDWDSLKSALLYQHISGTIVVITREESIAKHCTDSKDHITNVLGLEDDKALDLFRKIAWKDKQWSKLSPEIEAISKILVSKCGGLPEVIVAIGKKSEPTLEYLKSINSDFIRNLENFIEFPSLRGLFCWMQTYFDSCSDELKPCIFYLSVFSADKSIRLRHLLRRWIAEGYSSATADGTAVEKGEKLWSDLMKLSIVYPEQKSSTLKTQKSSTLKTCKVNGFFLEYIKSRPMQDNLVFELEGSCSPNSRLMGQHLTIRSSWDRDVNVFNSIDLSRLRSLTVYGEWRSFLICDKMKILRVLDLEGTSTSNGTSSVTDDDLELIVKCLTRVKFLSLRGCVHITRLPDSLGDMRQLETLDARHTSIVKLPPAIISKLHKMQHIRAGTSKDTSLVILQTKASPPAPAPAPQTPPREDSHGGMSPLLRDAAEAASTGTGSVVQEKWWKLKNHRNLHTRRRVAANGGGVEVGHAAAKGFGRMTELHTLGVVNVAGGKGALVFLDELKKLTQLRKLGLSGINRENWRNLCDAISGNLHHLESLTLQLMLLEEEGGSFEFAFFDHMPNPPKTLNILKVQYTTTGGHAAGVARISPGWMKKLPNIGRLDNEVTISTLQDIKDADVIGFTRYRYLIKPIQEHLSFEQPAEDKSNDYGVTIYSFRVECSSTLSHSKVTFGYLIYSGVNTMGIHCCCGSSAGPSTAGSSSCNLKIAGLHNFLGLEEVKVTGTYSDGLKRDLHDQLRAATTLC